MNLVRATLFGPPAVEARGAPTGISRRKALALFAYLCCSGRAHTREHLAAMFWPESDEARARAGLRQALAELTRRLGQGVLSADRNTIEIDSAADITVDAREFQDLYQTITRATATPDAPALRQALDLAAAEFMEGFTLPDCPAFDDWLQATRSGFTAQAVELARRLVEILRANGEIAQAVEQARRLVARDPLDETHRRLLMRVLFEAGDRRAAIRQFRDCSLSLKAELGVEPEPETVELHRWLQRAPLSARSRPSPRPERKRLGRPARIAMSAAAVLALLAVLSVGTLASLRGWFGLRNEAPRTLAVLPVKPWCGDPAADGYCEMMTHELITDLAGRTGLRVTPHASVRQYHNTVKRVPQIARELGVNYVLDVGSFCEGSLVVFSVHLIHARRDECMWTGMYAGGAENLLAEQQRLGREITAAVAERLR